MKISRFLALGILVLFLVASCGKVPTASPLEERPATTGESPSLTSVVQQPTGKPTVEPSPSLITSDHPPTPWIVEPTPFVPEELLPTNLPTIAYAVQREGQPAQLWALYYEGGLLQEKLVLDLAPDKIEKKTGLRTTLGFLRVGGLIFSPDGQYVAMNQEAYEGVGATSITRISDGEVHLPPGPIEGDVSGTLLAWIPGSERFVWAGADGANWGVLDIDGTDFVQFSTYDVLDAVVTPDGKRIIFSKIPVDGTWLGAIGVDGSDLAPFSLKEPLPGGYIRNLALSSDGQLCAFTKERAVSYHGGGQIWIMSADGSDQHSIGSANTYDFDLAWSPDNSTIAFVRMDDVALQTIPIDLSGQATSLRLIDVKSGKEQLLVPSEGNTANWSPKWLPDGSGLVFLSTRSGKTNLWFVRADGTGLQLLTHQGGLAGEVAVPAR